MTVTIAVRSVLDEFASATSEIALAALLALSQLSEEETDHSLLSVLTGIVSLMASLVKSLVAPASMVGIANWASSAGGVTVPSGRSSSGVALPSSAVRPLITPDIASMVTA